MDMVEAMNTWNEMGNSFVSHDTKEAYWTYFVKDGKVVGYYKAASGGLFWDYPQELLDYVDANLEDPCQECGNPNGGPFCDHECYQNYHGLC